MTTMLILFEDINMECKAMVLKLVCDWWSTHPMGWSATVPFKFIISTILISSSHSPIFIHQTHANIIINYIFFNKKYKNGFGNIKHKLLQPAKQQHSSSLAVERRRQNWIVDDCQKDLWIIIISLLPHLKWQKGIESSQNDGNDQRNQS